MSKTYDLAVIGAGPGGYVCAIRAAQLGMSVVCIEKRSKPGGTCLNVGCIPSKALLQSSEYFDIVANHGRSHGIVANKVSCDFAAMQERKNGVVEGLTQGVRGLLKKNKVDLLQGTATFTSANTLKVVGEGEVEIDARNIVIATGSEPIELPFLPFDEKRVLSSTGALALEKVPSRMVVIGAGVIGVELASVYRRLGTEVQIVEMLDLPCAGMDEALSKELLKVLKKQGLIFHMGAKVEKGSVEGSGVSIAIKKGGDTEVLNADVVLVAVGRKPNAVTCGLDKIGVVLDGRGLIPVDGYFRTSVPNVYAIGDVIEGVQLAHRASEEGVAVAEIIAGHTPHMNYVTIPNIVYTSPEIASVGLTEAEAKEASIDIITGKFAFKANARARCHGEDDGFVKVIGDKGSGRLIGMHIIGPSASEMIHEGAVAIEKGMTLEELGALCHGHPTLSEAIKEAALAALGKVIHS